jgi:hypothetical protein
MGDVPSGISFIPPHSKKLKIKIGRRKKRRYSEWQMTFKRIGKWTNIETEGQNWLQTVGQYLLETSINVTTYGMKNIENKIN